MPVMQHEFAVLVFKKAHIGQGVNESAILAAPVSSKLDVLD